MGEDIVFLGGFAGFLFFSVWSVRVWDSMSLFPVLVIVVFGGAQGLRMSCDFVASD